MTVSIARDTWGIGHATAGSSSDAFWAQGWMAAADRMWQMEWDRRRAMGTWAEVAGPVAVAEDVFARRLGLATVARAHWEQLSEPTRVMTEAYAAGVNAWLDTHGDDLPAEFDVHPAPPARWEAWHCLAVYKIRHLFMGTLHRKLWRAAVTVAAGPEITRALAGEPDADTAMIPPSGDHDRLDLLQDAVDVLARAADDLAGVPDVDGGSNSWAVHGSRTASGKPLLAGDPHRGIEFPNVYYQCHLTCPEFDVIGLAFPGVPGFAHFGHNADVAWCITHGMADDTDVFVERDPVVVERVETVEVAGGDPVEVPCASNPRGPVVLGDLNGSGAVLSAMWTGLFHDDTTFECLTPMMQARSVGELEAAVEPWVIPVNNLLSADGHGTISFRIRGRLVERSVASRWAPVPGTAEHEWSEDQIVDDTRLHRWRNPERGFLVTANNRTSDDPPYVSLDFAGPSRHDRIVELLTPLTQATVDDMTATHTDTASLVAPELTECFLRARPSTPAGEQARELLARWDHRLAAESAAACVYATTRRLWSDFVAGRLNLHDPQFGSRGWPAAVAASRMMFEAASGLLTADRWQVLGIGTSDELASVLGQIIDQAAASVADRLGDDPAQWRWADLHVMVSPHPLAVARTDTDALQPPLHPPLDGVDGDGDTVRATSTAPALGERAATGSVARYVFDLSDWDRSGWTVPHGVSGVRGSGHDVDQRSSWLHGKLLPMLYSAEAVAAATHTTETLTPDL